uniref:Immunoglobulin V-set domain-containing protein n=1 Tax=Haplochromis burtoni TaxID=8153 RepID=A0A3Q3C4G8_HAPBU
RIYRAGTLSAIMKSIFFFSCFLYVIIKVEGFEGRNVSFQCSHTLAWKNHKYFCKDPCTRMEDILVTVESGRRAESGRITLVDSGNGSFSVTFSHLQLSDSQKYRCGLFFLFFFLKHYFLTPTLPLRPFLLKLQQGRVCLTAPMSKCFSHLIS